MALPRFLVPDLAANQSIELPENEAHHASRVLRCNRGDSVTLFDGLGHEGSAEVTHVDKRYVCVQVGSLSFAPKDHNNQLHLAVALPKGDRQRSVIEKLIELGVDSLIPLHSARSVALIDEDNSERIHRFAIEACKQSGRNRLMQIRKPMSLDALLASESAKNRWVLHPNHDQYPILSIPEATRRQSATVSRELVFCIGPEGGFTNIEIDTAVQHGATLLTLGDRILRVETAVCTAAILGSLWLQTSSESAST
jgi:16S rRNA (uracil1498-N3)-methyltransferase